MTESYSGYVLVTSVEASDTGSLESCLAFVYFINWLMRNISFEKESIATKVWKPLI